MSFPTSARARVLAIIAALLGGSAIVITLAPDNPSAPPTTLTVHVDGLDAGKAPDRTIEAPKKIVQAVAPALEDQLKEPPAATPQAQLDAAAAAEKQIAETQAPLPTAGASAGFSGCRTSFVRNQSSRNGVRPQLMWDHYTVSHNATGWADVNAVNALFDRPSSQASSNFIIDGEGHCAYVVPIEAKAWTQAGANRTAISFEIIAYGNEKQYLPAAGLRKLAAVQKQVSRRTGIPMRRGAVKDCAPIRPGIVQHKDGGICAGGHVDIAPFSITQVVRDTIALAGGKPITATDRVTCRKINWWRTHGRHYGPAEDNAIRRKAALTHRGVTCTTHGPVRR